MRCIKSQVKVHIVHIFHIYFTDTLYPLPPHFYFNNNKYYKYNIYYYWEEERVLEGVYVENVEYVYYVYLVFFRRNVWRFLELSLLCVWNCI